jgi:hypothetical protein
MLGTPLLSPAELFGELLHEVQVRRLFSDGKYFVDMEPLLHPAQILSHYHRLGPCDDAALAAFVARHFVAPADRISVLDGRFGISEARRWVAARRLHAGWVDPQPILGRVRSAAR